VRAAVVQLLHDSLAVHPLLALDCIWVYEVTAGCMTASPPPWLLQNWNLGSRSPVPVQVSLEVLSLLS
jgi:hypothetical protein